jgi:Fe2+ or Zn2+ uptake regulation protein
VVDAVGNTVEDDRPIEQILDTIGDSHARQILAAVSGEPVSAKYLAEECDISLPTVYRRLETLKEHDLVTGRTKIDEDGNEFQVYECNFDSTVISLEDAEYDVQIYRQENLPERFTQLWDDLQTD